MQKELLQVIRELLLLIKYYSEYVSEEEIPYGWHTVEHAETVIDKYTAKKGEIE